MSWPGTSSPSLVPRAGWPGTATAAVDTARSAMPDQQSGLLKYPNFSSFTRQLRSTADAATLFSTGVFLPSSDFVDGRQVLSLTVPSNNYNRGNVRMSLGGPVDMRNGNATVYAKRDTNGEANIIIELHSAGTPAAPTGNYHSTELSNSEVSYTLDPTNGTGSSVFGKIGNATQRFVATGTGANLQAITHVNIRIGTGSGASYSMLLSDFIFTPNPRTKAAVILRMDDAWKDAYTTLRPMFEAKGVPNIPFLLSPGAVVSANGYNGAGFNTTTPNPDRMSIAQVNEMRARGWQSGTQAWTTENAQADYAAYLTEYNGMIQYNRDRGWIEDAADASYYSNVNMGTANARAAMIAAGSRTCQRFVGGQQSIPPFAVSETFPPRDQYQMMAINLNGLAPDLNANPARSVTSQLMAQLDRTVAQNGVLIVAGHQDMAQQATEYAALQALVDRFVSVGDFEFHSPNSLFNPFLAQYGPAPIYPAAYSGKS